jgi:hypothetical protein
MAFNPYLYQKLIAERHAQIQYEVRQSRVLAHAGRRHTLVRSSVEGLGTLLVELGSQLQRSGAALRSS